MSDVIMDNGSINARVAAFDARHGKYLIADQRILFEPVLRRQTALLRRDERQHGLQRIQAEVPSLRDPYATRLRDLEVVSDLKPADRAALDPLDGDADVVEAHLRHVYAAAYCGALHGSAGSVSVAPG